MRKFDNWLSKLDRKFGRYAIRNLMLYIVLGQAVVFAFGFIISINMSHLLYFNLPLIMNGQFWRVITFILLPQSNILIFAIISMYFSWLIASHLENEWGALKFNIYYFLGVVGAMLGGLVTGFATNVYIHLSLFLAFAILYPNFSILLFFILPIKVKYMAYVSATILAFNLVVSDWGQRVAIIISILNLILFFGPVFMDRIKSWNRKRKWSRNFK
jgi:hypothetical protein